MDREISDLPLRREVYRVNEEAWYPIFDGKGPRLRGLVKKGSLPYLEASKVVIIERWLRHRLLLLLCASFSCLKVLSKAVNYFCFRWFLPRIIALRHVLQLSA